MAQKKSHEVDSWLKKPDPETRLVLVYGPDRGLVSERATLFVKHLGLDANDPFSSVRLDASEVEATPGRLSDEAGTVPMFSDRRLIWIKGAGAQKQLAEEVKSLAAKPPKDAIIVIEAGDLKKTAPLRTAIEGAFAGMALPCYADEGRSLDSVIDEIMGQQKLRISPDARQAVKAGLGGDRLASRREIEKLALYCHGEVEVTLADVETVTGNVAGLSVDEAVDAVLTGNAASFDTTFTRLVGSGSQPFLVLASAMRQFSMLQLMRAEMDSANKPASAVVASARPPVFFARRKLVEGALQRWSAASIARALERLQAAVLLTRQRPDLQVATARQALIALVVEAARSRR
jgi:DNA polymerase-3 subunit delta